MDATIAYVAPNDVVDSEDVYERFLDNVGTDPACRTKLQDVQREALKRRNDAAGFAGDAGSPFGNPTALSGPI